MENNRDISASGKSSVYSLFYAQVRRNRDAIAIEYQKNTWSYGTLDEAVRRLASVFTNLGIAKRDRVAIISENRPEYIVAELACAMTGAIIACQNWRLSSDELKHCIALVNPKLLIVSKRFANYLNELDLSNLEIINLDDGYTELLGNVSAAISPQSLDPEEGIVILYTSGTTGLPKGALISHRAQIARMCALRLDTVIREQDAFIAWTPMFHMASTDQLLNPLMSGSTVIIIDGLKPDAITDAASRYDLGWLVMLPGSIKPMIEHLKKTKPKLKSIACIGAMADLVPRQEVADLTELMGAPYLNSFGATETGLPPASAALIPPGITDYSLSKKVNSLCEVRLIDADGKEVNDGKTGELTIRGATVFSGYWNAEETNAKEFDGGWFRMGDLFRRNPDGTLDFVDRAKYMIKSGGENIYPAEIERILLADERILDAVVIRKQDTQWGEVPVAFISRTDEELTEDEVDILCRTKLASYKRPKEVRFIELNEFPRSTTGKIQRHEMESWL